MFSRKKIALVAHDNMKKELIHFVESNHEILIRHKLFCTGTTGTMVEEAILSKRIPTGAIPDITKFKSGPLGGDQQLGALIAEGDIDIIIFFWDPMQPQPHDVDVKALLRICVLYNVVTACNRSTADFIISSTLFSDEYLRQIKDYSSYINRYKE
jgi:methylglyoxal synthase